MNAQVLQYGMDISVFQTLAQKEENGMTPIDPVSVLIIKYGRMKLVFLQKFYVRMVRFGIQRSMHVFVHQEHFLLLIVVILSHFAMETKSIILTIINANALMVYSHQEIDVYIHHVLKT